MDFLTFFAINWQSFGLKISVKPFNSFPDDKILDWSKFKAFADDKINVN